MGFQKPARTGGDFLDVKAETADGPRLLAFKILGFDAPEDGDYPDPNNPGAKQKIYPVRAHCLVCDGPNRGRYYAGRAYKYAIANALRGVSGSDPSPITVVGQAMIVRAERGKKKGKVTDTVWGNQPSDAEMDAAAAVFTQRFPGVSPDDPWYPRDLASFAVEAEQRAAQANGQANGQAAGGQPAPQPAAQPTPQPAPEPVGAGVGASGAQSTVQPAQSAGSGPRRPFGRRT